MITFTEADIRAGANSQSYSRGYEYYQSDAVSDLVRRGNLLTAAVEGSQYRPYDVRVSLDEAGGIAAASCTCPYDWGGYCKHIVAVLLTVLNDETEVALRPDIETLLAVLSEAQMRRLIRALVEDQPQLIKTIEREIGWLQAPTAPGAVAATPAAAAIDVDLAAIRRQIHKDWRLSGARGGGYSERYHLVPYPRTRRLGVCPGS